jgi:hypothetical protein
MVNVSLEVELWMMWQDEKVVAVARAAAGGQHNTAPSPQHGYSSALQSIQKSTV